MSDSEIRQIIIKRKKQEREAERKATASDLITDAVCWLGWVAMILSLAVIAA